MHLQNLVALAAGSRLCGLTRRFQTARLTLGAQHRFIRRSDDAGGEGKGLFRLVRLRLRLRALSEIGSENPAA
jgi:hypothetical protein